MVRRGLRSRQIGQINLSAFGRSDKLGPIDVPAWLSLLPTEFLPTMPASVLRQSLRTLVALFVIQGAVLGAAELIATPAKVEIHGAGERFTLLVDRQTNDGRLIDVTPQAKFAVADTTVVRVSPTGELSAVNDGHTTVTISSEFGSTQVPVTVRGTKEPRSFNFENDITPLLTRFSCNYSGCHGKAEGQNGFKLSVFGFDPVADHGSLVKESRGRRLFLAAPERSLFLQKAAGMVPHGGGPRIERDSREYEVIRGWIAAGAPLGTDSDPKVQSIELSPDERVLDLKSQQRLRVLAKYTDGRVVDVTSLAKFQSNNDGVANVDETGLIQVGDTPGQVAIMASYAGQVDVFLALIPRAEKIDNYPQLAETNFIDRLVHAKLKKLNIVPSGVCDDATFLRRVTLDLIGTLPTADEARAFLADSRPDKRLRWVDALLDRPELADFWALKWADLLRVERNVLGHKGAHDYYQWIRTSFATNKPLDRFAHELLTAEGPLAESPAAQFYKVVQKPGDMASTVSQVFLGVRIACAECHHHPHDRWSQTDYFGMTAYFTPLNRKQSPRGDSLFAMGRPQATHPRTGEKITAHPLGVELHEEATADSSQPLDRRPELAAWLADRKNPWFAKNLANRIWAHLMGRGLVEPVDDVRATNPPSNPELLDALSNSLTDDGFDFRKFVRTIVASQSYQRATEPNATNERDEQNYSRALFKRLDAEVLLDAVCQTTGVNEKFQGVPSGARAIQLWDSKVSHYFLRLFGRPVRSSACTCERNAEPNVSQVLHLLNSPELQAKFSHRGGALARLAQSQRDDRSAVDELYLTFYARQPSDEERATAIQFLAQSGDRREQAVQDLAWSLLNTLEFVFNH